MCHECEAWDENDEMIFLNQKHGYCYRCRRKVQVYFNFGNAFCKSCNAIVKRVFMSEKEKKAMLDFFRPLS